MSCKCSIFRNPWELVVRAQWRKYPNKFNQAVEGVDVVDRCVDKNGVLQSHRLLSTKWGIPGWATAVCWIMNYHEIPMPIFYFADLEVPAGIQCLNLPARLL